MRPFSVILRLSVRISKYVLRIANFPIPLRLLLRKIHLPYKYGGVKIYPLFRIVNFLHKQHLTKCEKYVILNLKSNI